MRTTPTVAITVLGSLALFAPGQAARAQPAPSDEDRARAAAAFDQGVARFRIGDHAAALAAFEEAYRLAPAAAVLYNVGKTRAALGRDAPAYTALERYLSESGPSVPTARRSEVMRLLGQLRPRIASVVIELRPEGALLAIDGGPADPPPPGGVLYLAPGEHTIVVSAEGQEPQTRTLSATGGGEGSLSVQLAPLPTPERQSPSAVPEPDDRTDAPGGPGLGEPEPIPPPRHVRPREAGGLPGGAILLGTVGLVALATTAVTGILALGAAGEIDDARDAVERGEPIDHADLEDTASRGRTLATVADVALGVGVVALGVAVVLAVSGVGPQDDERAGPISFDGRRVAISF